MSDWMRPDFVPSPEETSEPVRDPSGPSAEPEWPKYEGYDGPRIVQRLNYAAAVLLVLADWVGPKPALPYSDLRQLARDFRAIADEELEDAWPK